MRNTRLKTKNVHTAEDYFNLPEEKRTTKHGFFIRPYALGMHEWDKWEEGIKERYPVQWFFRIWLTSHDNPVYSFFSIKRMQLREFLYGLKRWWNPPHKRIYKAARPFGWVDITTVIRNLNFAAIQDFKDEMDKSLVIWDSNEIDKTFYAEIIQQLQVIEHTLPEMQKDLDKALDFPWMKVNDKAAKDRHELVSNLEKQIFDTETEIMIWAIKNRDRFWT